jgi:pimeloyl-ACP methyl ester carboxylesterase
MDNPRRSKAWEFIVQPGAGTKPAPGGFYPPYGHIGHWEVTAKVIEEMGFSAPASNVLCDAAQDPDFYDFATPAAHAQTPDQADQSRGEAADRATVIEKAVEDYVNWVNERFRQCMTALENRDERMSLYWLGYALHGIEDLAVHKGITNGEHASAKDNPDFHPSDVALSYVYARRMLDAIRNGLGQDGFDRLRNYDGEGKLSYWEKHSEDVHPAGWDIDDHFREYEAAGERYSDIRPKPEPVRWDREVVLARVLEKILRNRRERMRTFLHSSPAFSTNPNRRFEVLNPHAPLTEPAEWTILIYMAGDDRNPMGIEYAISQDLAEIKQVGSTDSVHFIAQTDDATGNASYRYRLRKATDLASDQLERFDGDLNTGSTKTLVDFVQWAHRLFPAKRTGLVLWGHGSGHDDQAVYRTVRGAVSPRTAARLAQRRLGFFSGTRRSILEQGPTRGYGYDDTAGDFLDNVELRKALLQIRDILDAKLDLLGFDACLMAMIEVAYQIHDLADILVASERTEPGDGWWYSRAFRRLPLHPETMPEDLAKEIVHAYRDAYRNDMTLSAIDLSMLPLLADKVSQWSKVALPADFHQLRRSGLDCSPRPGDGYCDLGSFLDAASDPGQQGCKEAAAAREELQEAVIASCGGASGLTIYAPGNFRPQEAGSTDSLYLGLKFVRATGWGAFLGGVYPPLYKPATGIETLPIPTPTSGLDRFNARRVLAAVMSDAKEGWLDRLRSEILRPCIEVVESTVKQLDPFDPPPPGDPLGHSPPKKGGRHPAEGRRILILPGIMGSLLHDRAGKLGGVWIDLWNLVFGDDFEALKLKWETTGQGGKRVRPPAEPIPLPLRIPDADAAVRIEAYGVIPLIYDRMALALMHEFGPVVEFAPFDWRQPIDYLGKGLAVRIEALLQTHPGIQIGLVAHSMGGLVATDALAKLAAADRSMLDAVRSFVALGTPFLGSGSVFQALRAEERGLDLLRFLGRKSTEEIENTVQSFRGLFDMLPGDQPALLKPGLFAPGPLSRLLPGDARLDSPLRRVRDLPPLMLERTRAIVCTTESTTGSPLVREDGSVDCSSSVAGDGTVSANSALNSGKLLPQSRQVHEAHMTLPLDGKAIEHTCEWVGKQFGAPPSRSTFRAWPAAPQIRLPAGREELMRRLEDEDELTLGDYVALLSLI